MASRTSTRFYVIFRSVLKFIIFSKVYVYSITCFFISVIRIHLENRADAKMGIFPIPVVYWSGFGIFKQNASSHVRLDVFRAGINELYVQYLVTL